MQSCNLPEYFCWKSFGGEIYLILWFNEIAQQHLQNASLPSGGEAFFIFLHSDEWTVFF